MSPARPRGSAPERSGGAVEHLVAAKEVIVTCGPGGVGKTTVAAALAAEAARRSPGRVLVLTVDPARRLADSFGMHGLGNEARRVPPEAFAATGSPARGELWAAMLDTAASWDALVRQHAPDEATARKILVNPLYRNITGRFARSHEYIAMERLHQLRAEGRYDLLVVDTPPSTDALDFLDAPERMAEFFSSTLLRWLVAPGRSRLVNMASRPFSQVADRILGMQFLEDIAEFFLLFQQMHAGFTKRAQAVSALLREPSTTFIVVTSLEPGPVAESMRLAGELARRHLSLGLLVANKTLPSGLDDPGAAALAEELAANASSLGEAVAGSSRRPAALSDPERVARVIGAVGHSFTNFRKVAQREHEMLEQLAGEHQVVATVPNIARDVVDLAALLEVGRHLFDPDQAGRQPPARGRRS
ncbi:MAG: oxyanion-translocating ATPase [Acidimicrobiaceae bacterium]|nr:oxyanion-translocating ATPase [Acidimicrobiaceae bacterium]